MKRPPLKADRELVLPPTLAGGIASYALALRYGHVRFDFSQPFNKRRKEAHRYTIADTRGLLRLTVPITHPESSREARWADIRVSTHGEWWAQHLTALESAYGRTPYFEFYVDRFAPLFRARTEESAESLEAFSEAFNREILSSLGWHESEADAVASDQLPDLQKVELPPYYQVRADRLGFIPELSVLDLLFNLGPEAPVYLASLDLPSD